MANYKDTYNGNNIQFNSVNVNVLPRTKSIGNENIVGASSEDLIDIAEEYGGKLPSTVNAVEIDWNGAQVAGKTLNTTGEVLSSYKIAI